MDVESALEGFLKQKRKFDIIVLDPPALAKSKKNFFAALRKYGQLNKLAMKCLEPGGILFSCSCSHHVKRDDFIKLLGGPKLWSTQKLNKIIPLYVVRAGTGKQNPSRL